LRVCGAAEGCLRRQKGYEIGSKHLKGPSPSQQSPAPSLHHTLFRTRSNISLTGIAKRIRLMELLENQNPRVFPLEQERFHSK
jgi:hypothetical protein